MMRLALVCGLSSALATCHPPDTRRASTANDTVIHAPIAPADTLRFSPRTNRAREIHWHAFTPAALAEAVRLHRPVFLSVAAIWCHWCHVLDETTLSDPRVIERVNRSTIPVRIDADQNPDVERRYLLGGWPTVALLDGEGRILDGGSYMPPTAFLAMLDRVTPIYLREGEHAYDLMGGASDRVRDERAPGTLAADDETALATRVLAQLDDSNGGFAGRQKFPMGEVIAFLLDRLEHGDVTVRAPLRRWLDGIARGLYDASEGGFYRYATRADWSAPHFEKMARTNAQLIVAFARASVLFAQPDDAARARGAWQWAWRVLRRDDLFGASQDADEAYSAASPEARRSMQAPYVDPTALASWNADLAAAGLEAARVLHDDEMGAQAATIARAVLARFVRDDGAVAHVVRGGERVMLGDLGDIGPVVAMASALSARDGEAPLAIARRVVAWGRAHLAASDGGWFDRIEGDSAPGLVRQRYRDAELNAELALGLAALAVATHDAPLAREVEAIAAAFADGARHPDPAAARFAMARSRVATIR